MKLSEIETQKFKDISSDKGDFGEDHPGYSWSFNVEELQSDLLTSQSYHLARIEITVSNDDENTYQLRTYRFLTD